MERSTLPEGWTNSNGAALRAARSAEPRRHKGGSSIQILKGFSNQARQLFFFFIFSFFFKKYKFIACEIICPSNIPIQQGPPHHMLPNQNFGGHHAN